MSRIVHGLIGIVCVGAASLASATGTATVAGKVLGWPSGNAGALRPAVVWLEGDGNGARSPKAVMAQRAGQFVPTFLVVVVGQTVEMPNLDEVAHNVYSFSPSKPFNLGFYAKGQLKTITFDRVGVVEVGCSIHNFMHAKIVVVPNSFYATVGVDGSFHIRGVPAGQYTVKFWGEGLEPLSRRVIVPADGDAEIDFAVSLATAAGK